MPLTFVSVVIFVSPDHQRGKYQQTFGSRPEVWVIWETHEQRLQYRPDVQLGGKKIIQMSGMPKLDAQADDQG